MANFDEVSASDLTSGRLAPGLRRVRLSKYLRDKLQGLVERAETTDLVDVISVFEHSEALKGLARRALASLDEISQTKPPKEP